MLSDSVDLDTCSECMGFQDCEACCGSGEGGFDRACATCRGTGVHCECSMDDEQRKGEV